MARKRAIQVGESGFTVEVKVTPATEAPTEPDKTTTDFVSKGRVHVCKSEDKREVVCVAMVADEIDAHGDLFTAAAVENAANGFLANYNSGTDIGRDHSGETPDIDLIGSWYTENAVSLSGLDAPQNAWIVKFRVNDSQTWEDVKSGKLGGVSIQGPASYIQPENNVSVSKSVDSQASDSEAEQPEQPKRVFVDARPYQVDLVDAGANRQVLIWKAAKPKPESNMSSESNASNPETPETPEVAVTKAVSPKPVSEAPSAPESAPASEPVAADVAKGNKQLTKDRKKAFSDGLKALQALAAELAIEDEGDETPAVAEVAKSETSPAPQNADVVKALETVMAPIAKAIEGVASRVEALETERSPSAVVPEGETPPAAKPKPTGPFGGVFTGIFGTAP